MATLSLGDCALHTLHLEWNRLQKTSFALFQVDLQITPTKVPHEGSDTSHSWRFGFALGWLEPQYLRVSLASCPFQVEVIPGIWQTLQGWASSLVKEEPFFNSERHRSRLAEWWKFRGDTFRYLELHAELRDMILRYALFPSGERVAVPYRATLGCPAERDCYPEGQHNLNLLRVSKQVSAEAIAILYKTPTFTFYSRLSVEKFFSRTPQTHLDKVLHISLRLILVDYLDLFGAIVQQEKDYGAYRGAQCKFGCLETFKLNSLPDVLTLQLHISHPAERFPNLPLQHNTKIGITPFCHQAMVTKILKHAAFYMFRQRSRLQLTGYVTQGQKVDFFECLQSLAHEEDCWVHEIKLDDDWESGMRSTTDFAIADQHLRSPYDPFGAGVQLPAAVEDINFYNLQDTETGTRVFAPAHADDLTGTKVEIRWKPYLEQKLRFNLPSGDFTTCVCKWIWCDQDLLPDLGQWYNETWGKIESDDEDGKTGDKE